MRMCDRFVDKDAVALSFLGVGRVYVIRGGKLKVKNEGSLCVLLKNHFHVFPQKLYYQNSVNASISDKVRVRYCDNGMVGYARPRWLVPL